jgi:hypothetical protein
VVKVRPRTRDEFAKIAAAAGWQLERVLETAITYHVRLRKAAWTP